MKEALVTCGALHLGQVLMIATEFCSGPQHSARSLSAKLPAAGGAGASCTLTFPTDQTAQRDRPGITGTQVRRPQSVLGTPGGP